MMQCANKRTDDNIKWYITIGYIMSETKKKTLRQILLGWGAKILLALLILSFGVWGIGDYVAPQQNNEVIASVGESKITLSELQNEVQYQISKLQQVLGPSLTIQKAKSMGVIDNILQSLIRRTVFAEGAKSMGLVISDELASREIRDDEQFKSKFDKFDRMRFDEATQRAGLSENSYIALYKGQLLQNQYLSGINNTQVVPRKLINSIYQYRNEKRTANYIEIKHSSFKSLPTASEMTLRTFHKKHPEIFTAPEYRAITLVQLGIEDIIDEIDVSNNEIKESYEDRISEFQTPERRTIQQLLVSNKAKSIEIYNRIIAGISFIEAAEDIKEFDPQSLELGTLTREQLPIKILSDTAFNLPENVVSSPVKSPLGWHILRVKRILPAKLKTLNEVSKNIKTTIAAEKAVDDLYKLSTKFEDELGGGSSIEEAAKKLNFRVRKIKAVSATGFNLANKKIKDLSPAVVQVAFNTEQNQDSALTDFGDEGYFILHVDDVTPPALRPFSEALSDVERAWRSEQQVLIGEKKSKSLIKRLKLGTSLDKIAKELNLKVKTSMEFTRSGAGLRTPFPGELITGLFGVNKNDFFSATSDDSNFIAQIKSIKPADIVSEKKGLDALKKQLQDNFKNDIATQFANALRNKLAVTVDQATITTAF